MTERTILALDLAAQTGWALGGVYSRTPLSGSTRFARPGATMGATFVGCRDWLIDFSLNHPIDVVVFEAPMTPAHMGGRTNITTIRTLIGFTALAEEFFFRAGKDVREAKVGEVRRHFIGSSRHKRVAAKALTISACHRLGWKPADDNAADALALWHYQASIFEPRRALETSSLFVRR